MSRIVWACGGPSLIALLCAANAGAVTQDQWAARVTLAPPVVRLGEQAMYRGYVIVPAGVSVHWGTPDSIQALTWGPRRASIASTFDGGGSHRRLADTVKVEIPIQAFQLGRVELPGLAVQIGSGSSSGVYRLPPTTLTVLPMISPADSQATLKPVRGPLAAPWWERVPWIWVVAGLALVVGVVWLVLRLRRKRPAGVEALAPSRSPSEMALQALAELRQRQLPENGRMAEHAFLLGQILRRYLEATTRTTMPGHTTPELVRSLSAAGLANDDRQRLTGLLRVWDRVKFARAPLTVEEAVKSEQSVESFVRRAHAAPATEPEAGAA